MNLLIEIETALAIHGVSATAFGYRVMNDPAFVHRVRRGREVRAGTVEKVRAAIERLENGEPL